MRAETVEEERKAKMLTEPLMPLAQPQVLPWIVYYPGYPRTVVPSLQLLQLVLTQGRWGQVG